MNLRTNYNFAQPAGILPRIDRLLIVDTVRHSTCFTSGLFVVETQDQHQRLEGKKEICYKMA